MGKEKVLITAALPYINNVPHMGHIVGSHLPADVFYRYNKLIGNDAIFIGGSDEHGTPAMVTASEVGMNVKDLVDMLKVKHKEIYDKLNISYTNYSGTSSPVHSEVTADFFKTLDEKGYIEEKEMEMFYCDNCKMFLPDRFVVGTCPYCGYEQANGDQCEKCGRVFANAELLNPKCKTCGQTPTIKKSKHLFFNLEKTKDMLNSWIESKKDIFRPYVYAEAKRWINEGLKSRCITRDILWGIPVNKQGYENKVFYVWFEAPIGYISFVKELGDDMLKKYWLDKDAKIYHFLGKDNIPFHAVFFPAMLLANGNYNMPYNVIGYNFLNYEGQKFSKSRKIGVFCNPLLDSDIEIDALRAYLVSILPENKDTDWIWNEFKNCTNSELIGKFSNLFNRTINMIYKNFPNGLDFDYSMLSDLTDEDKTMVDDITNGPKKVLRFISKC
jgi:methionyl-tRNA synthetase